VVVVVEVLVSEDCPREDAALEVVSTSSRALGIRPRVVIIEVTSLDLARETAFVGSPTIRVDGRDVSPPTAGEEPSLDCRRYPTGDGMSHVPPRAQVTAALAAAITDH